MRVCREVILNHGAKGLWGAGRSFKGSLKVWGHNQVHGDKHRLKLVPAWWLPHPRWQTICKEISTVIHLILKWSAAKFTKVMGGGRGKGGALRQMKGASSVKRLTNTTIVPDARALTWEGENLSSSSSPKNNSVFYTEWNSFDRRNSEGDFSAEYPIVLWVCHSFGVGGGG